MEKRLTEHNSPRAAKYTRSRQPIVLVYHETFQTKSEAMKREHEIKKLSKKEKERLILSVPE